MAKYIEREKAFKELLDQCSKTGYGGLTVNDIKYVFSNLKNADVRPMIRGVWQLDDGGNPFCTNCGLVPEEISLFCPRCGADMRGKED